MNAKDRKWLEDNRENAHRLPMGGLENLLRIVQENFNNGYKPDLFCDICVAGLIRLAYERFDKMIKE